MKTLIPLEILKAKQFRIHPLNESHGDHINIVLNIPDNCCATDREKVTCFLVFKGNIVIATDTLKEALEEFEMEYTRIVVKDGVKKYE